MINSPYYVYLHGYPILVPSEYFIEYKEIYVHNIDKAPFLVKSHRESLVWKIFTLLNDKVPNSPYKHYIGSANNIRIHIESNMGFGQVLMDYPELRYMCEAMEPGLSKFLADCKFSMSVWSSQQSWPVYPFAKPNKLSRSPVIT